MRFLRVVGVLGVMMYGSGAYADWSGAVHVVKIATDVYPYQGVVFAVDGGPCLSTNGAWVYYRYGAAADDNLKAAFATVTAAYLAQRPVVINIPTGTCNVNVLRPQ